MTLPTSLTNVLRPPFWRWGLCNWHWRRPDGEEQGFRHMQDDPGLANLLWLALQMDRPPADGFDMRRWPFVMAVFARSFHPFTEGVTLKEWCATHTLAEFAALKPGQDDWLNHMIHLAKERLAHADA